MCSQNLLNSWRHWAESSRIDKNGCFQISLPENVQPEVCVCWCMYVCVVFIHMYTWELYMTFKESISETDGIIMNQDCAEWNSLGTMCTPFKALGNCGC